MTLDFLKELNELSAFFGGEGGHHAGDIPEILWDDAFRQGGSGLRELDQGEAAVAGNGGAQDEAVLFEGVQQAGHGGAGDSCCIGKRCRSFRLVRVPVQLHEDGEASRAELVEGQKAAVGGKNEVGGVQEMEEGLRGLWVEVRIALGGFE